MFKRLYSILCLIFLFAFTQQASIAHEISHIEDSLKHTQSHKSDLNSYQSLTAIYFAARAPPKAQY